MRKEWSYPSINSINSQGTRHVRSGSRRHDIIIMCGYRLVFQNLYLHRVTTRTTTEPNQTKPKSKSKQKWHKFLNSVQTTQSNCLECCLENSDWFPKNVIFSDYESHVKIWKTFSSPVALQLRIQHWPCRGSGLIPVSGNSACHRHSKKKLEKATANREEKGNQ